MQFCAGPRRTWRSHSMVRFRGPEGFGMRSREGIRVPNLLIRSGGNACFAGSCFGRGRPALHRVAADGNELCTQCAHPQSAAEPNNRPARPSSRRGGSGEFALRPPDPSPRRRPLQTGSMGDLVANRWTHPQSHSHARPSAGPGTTTTACMSPQPMALRSNR